MLRWLLTGCALSTLLVDSARAQAQVITWPLLSQLSSSSLYIGRPADPLDPHLLAAASSDTVAREIKPTHWKEDGIVGAVLIGGSSAWLGHAICRNSQGGSCTGALVGGALGGGLIGFLIGALIGGQFPKQPTSAPAETT